MPELLLEPEAPEPLLDPETPPEPAPEPEPVDPLFVPLLSLDPLLLDPLPLELALDPLLSLDPLLLDPLEEVPGLLLLEQATEATLSDATNTKRFVRTQFAFRTASQVSSLMPSPGSV